MWRILFVPSGVYKSVRDYFSRELPNYEVRQIVRKTNHPSDKHLFMVSAMNKATKRYTVWTCWNENTQSLNHGYYDLTEREIDEIFKKFYYSIDN